MIITEQDSNNVNETDGPSANNGKAADEANAANNHTDIELGTGDTGSTSVSTSGSNPVVNIAGSFTQAYVIDTLASYSTKSATSVIVIPLMGMKQLNQALGGLLIITPIISNLLTYIPMTWRVNKNGGKKEAMALMSLTLAGMTSLTILFSCTDITTVNGFDWRYGIMLASGFLIGHGAGVNLLMIDTLKWVPKKSYVPNLQLLYSFLVDSTAVTTPIVTYFLSQFGYYVPFSIYSGLILAGGLIELIFGNPSPYHQFRTKFPHERAKQLAVESGQLEEFLTTNYDDVSIMDMLRENLTVLFDRRSLLLGFTLFASLGSFFVSRTVLPRLLANGFGLTPDEAIVTSSLANLITILARPVASKMILYLDSKSGGVKIHILGCGMAIIGSTALAVGNLPRWGLYTSLAINNTGFGINMTTPLSIASSPSWSAPSDGTLKKVNPSTMFGLFGSIGALGGIMLPIFLGLLVDESGEKWYKQYFYLIMAMMLISAIGVPIINYQVNRKPGESLFKSAVSFFGRRLNGRELEQYAVRNEEAVDVEAQNTQNSIYVDAFI
ncbi:MFS transporter [Legionella quateirensis]|uniref:Major facilitator superfamily (MFS) profile domain-containing protein n=1 Tax=Legionella quateirensis TaxID=45072 RepID=A0A378KX21_9GAMM|nr:MFS transporter [Legionella quateirensis]KTD50846.1 hypothetical protein Lqua_1073 [Legionella quateirensis]STY17908.1 Uncharacterised protein [Legionella quateirensis]